MSSLRVPSRIMLRQHRQALIKRRYTSLESTHKADGSAFIKEREAVKKHAAESSDLWRKLSIYATIPALIITGINAYGLWNEHWEHWEHHMPPLEERVEYAYQNIRSKNFFWGDGDKTLFWNDKVNYHKHDE
ncbi:putative cytochrome c oxidase subunit VIa [Geopyxis carbonaria]|nr:putative cytochrome c oxidase subunit VIa [Geopyxis carbonaria]